MAGAITWNYDKYGTPPKETNKAVEMLEDFNTKSADSLDRIADFFTSLTGVFEWFRNNWKLAVVGAVALMVLFKKL